MRTQACVPTHYPRPAALRRAELTCVAASSELVACGCASAPCAAASPPSPRSRACRSKTGAVYLFERGDGTQDPLLVGVAPAFAGPITSLAFAPTGAWLAVGSAAGQLACFQRDDLRIGRAAATVLPSVTEQVKPAAQVRPRAPAAWVLTEGGAQATGGVTALAWSSLSWPSSSSPPESLVLAGTEGGAVVAMQLEVSGRRCSLQLVTACACEGKVVQVGGMRHGVARHVI